MGEQAVGGGVPGVVPSERSKAAAEAVADDRRADRSTDGERDPGGLGLGFIEVTAPQRLGPGATTMTAQSLELTPLVDPADQADRRVRPLSRRALRMDRPALVLMRARNPCLRARRRVFGWKVRFT